MGSLERGGQSSQNEWRLSSYREIQDLGMANRGTTRVGNLAKRKEGGKKKSRGRSHLSGSREKNRFGNSPDTLGLKSKTGRGASSGTNSNR